MKEGVIYPWKRENVLKGSVANKPGIYEFFSKDGRRIYTGHARRLRHRLQSYYQEDDFAAHRTKQEMRNFIAGFRIDYMPVKKAQRLERKIKRDTIFNYR